MSNKNIFQLTMVSQNDSGCNCGDQLTGELTNYCGGNLKAGSEPFGEKVQLPVPSNDPPPSPTWFLELAGAIELASFQVVVSGPNGDTPITINGAEMATWVAQNQNEKTNQVYLESSCGIFGYAQKNVAGGITNWIYTITAGVTNPVVHPA